MLWHYGWHYSTSEYFARYTYTRIIKNFGKDNAQRVAKATAEAIDLIKTNIEQYKIDCEFEEASAYLFSQTKEQTKNWMRSMKPARKLV
jgi:predicted phage tail protein